MEKYVKPETELIKVNTQETLLLAASLISNPATHPACSPKNISDEEEDDGIDWQWTPGRFW